MIAPARRVAYRILIEVAAGDGHSDDLLRAPEVDALSAQDRNLVTTLVFGTLRWQIALDARIRPLLAKPGAKLSREAEAALRMGAFQLLHLDRAPAHAVVHDSVELVKRSRERGASGLVNAVLRRIAAQGREPIAPQLSSAQEIAATFAHPAWMIDRWVRQYGLAAAEAICRWDQEAAGVTLRLRGPESVPAGLELDPGAFLGCARRLIRGDVASRPELESGGFRIQDEASQLVAEIAAAAAPAAARVLDTCAARGGKTAILAERLPCAAITALDVSRQRLEAMRRLLGTLLPGIQYEVADAATQRFEPVHDLILCDVPCSGTGTLARNPEIRFRVTEFDLPRQQRRQVAILQSALTGLASDGVLVYSTCSLEPEENEEVIEKVVNKVDGFTLQPVRPILEQLAQQGVVTGAGRERLDSAVKGLYLRTLPGVHPCDGFFAAVLRRD
ncbi:MAG TPA: transcription antitermination factor NusB [Acidobacteriaceae bacterium]|nr:transcription antitermination factor NusB [Acidobacteriaceae bacterium]